MLLLLAPMPAMANPLLVGDYLDSRSVLATYDGVSAADKPDYQKAHRAELLQAHQVLEDVQTAYNAILDANKWTMAHYGRAFLCNGGSSSIERIIAHFQTRRMQETKVSESVAESRTRQIPIELVLADEMLRMQPCPDWKR